MSPSSGARSGTKPSRAGRGAGDGRQVGVTLACGHFTHDPDAVVVFPGGRRLYQCPVACGLQERKR